MIHPLEGEAGWSSCCLDSGPEGGVHMSKSSVPCSAASMTGQVTHLDKPRFPKLYKRVLGTTELFSGFSDLNQVFKTPKQFSGTCEACLPSWLLALANVVLWPHQIK